MDPALQELILLGNQEQEVEAIIRLKEANNLPEGLQIVSQFGDIITCRLKHQDIEAIWSDDVVASMKAPRYVGIDPNPEQNSEVFEQFSSDEIITNRKALIPNGGKGVVIGVIDWGFDFTHPNFLDEDGHTRFLSIWNQAEELDASALKYGYGKVYSRERINEALASETPFQDLGYHPFKGDPLNDGAHGTHVLDIAAGNGTIGTSSNAPQADIIAVHLSAGNIGALSSLGDSVRILEAIDFIADMAGDRPLVINMSVGKHGGPHNGKTLVEQGMDNFLKERVGRCIVQSTGNYFNARTHASAQLKNGERKSLTWHVYRSDKTYNELEIYLPPESLFRVALVAPSETCVTEVALGDKKDIQIGGETVGRFYYRKNEPNTGFNHVDIFLYSNAPPGDWEVVLKVQNTPTYETWFHAWIERDGSCMGCQSRFEKADSNPFNTTGTICNGEHTIAVGAYDLRTNKIASFSSAGPTIDGRKKPILIAPGVHIQAAKSAGFEDNRSKGELTIKSGTSMAAPQITSAVAALFGEIEKLLPIQETHRLLESSLDDLSIKGNTERVGLGTLDVLKLVNSAHKISEISITMKTDNTLNNNEFSGVEIHGCSCKQTEKEADNNTHEEDNDDWEMDGMGFDDTEHPEGCRCDFCLELDSYEEILHAENCTCSVCVSERVRRHSHQEQELSYETVANSEFVRAISNNPMKFRLDSDVLEIVAKEGKAKTQALRKGDIIITEAIGEGILFKSVLEEAINLNSNGVKIGNVFTADSRKQAHSLVLTDAKGELLPQYSILRLKDSFETVNNFASVAARIAIKEEKKWKYENGRRIKEDSNSIRLKLQTYWGSLSNDNGSSRVKSLINSSIRKKTNAPEKIKELRNILSNQSLSSRDKKRYRKRLAKQNKYLRINPQEWYTNHPWSAVFISWLMRQAGARNSFFYSSAHIRYIYDAYINRKERTPNKYWYYSIENGFTENDLPLAIGDLICLNRGESKFSKRTLNKYYKQNRKRRKVGGATHCDIITNIFERRDNKGNLYTHVETIGGNVKDSVTKTNYKLGNNGKLIGKKVENIFGVLKFNVSGKSKDLLIVHNKTRQKSISIQTKLKGSVGRRGDNFPQDVIAVKNRLNDLGFSWATLDNSGKPTLDMIKAIKLFQGIINGNEKWESKDGLIDVNRKTDKWLKASNAPRWISLPDRGNGWEYKIAVARWGDDRFCTDWMKSFLDSIGQEYIKYFGTDLGGRSPITVHELSAKRGKNGGHKGHRTGLLVDIRLPRRNGGVGRVTYYSQEYDKETTKVILRIARNHPLFRVAIFNDPDFVREGLCIRDRNPNAKIHDNHIHIKIKPPSLGDNSFSIKGLSNLSSHTTKRQNSSPQNVDIAKAIRYNIDYQYSLDWRQYLPIINELLALPKNTKVTEGNFAIAVAKFQKKQKISAGRAKGILGQRTWRKMRPIVLKYLDFAAQDKPSIATQKVQKVINAFSAITRSGLSINQQRAVEKIVDAFEVHGDDDKRKLAYILATAWHESRLRPVREGFKKSDAAARIHVQNRKYGREVNGHVYYGRGFVQLTWDYNYKSMAKAFDIDLYDNPDLALNLDIAADILVYGMMRGSFTGVGLRKFISEDKVDFFNARRVVNSLDKAELIRAYAVTIWNRLQF